MTDREKLIDLLESAESAIWWSSSDETFINKIADHLIANGVVISKMETTTQRWIPVTERLPEDGEQVLCWYEYFRYGNYNRLYQTYGIGYQFHGNWGGEVSNGHKCRVIAWMPMPDPPKEE